MKEAHERDEWRRAARICQVVANHSGRRKRAATDAMFNDYADKSARKQKPKLQMAPITILKHLFVPKKPRKKPCPQPPSEQEPPTLN